MEAHNTFAAIKPIEKVNPVSKKLLFFQIETHIIKAKKIYEKKIPDRMRRNLRSKVTKKPDRK